MKQKINEKALKYLIEKKGKKGTEINNLNIQMASYLLPNNEGVSVTDKRNIFAMRNRMTDIPQIFQQRIKLKIVFVVKLKIWNTSTRVNL